MPSRVGVCPPPGRLLNTGAVRELAVVIVSHNSASWLEPCLRSLYAHAGGVKLDVVVVDNESSDGSAELVEREFVGARVVRSANRGFAYGNNRGLESVSAPFVLLLNPDTEIVEGTFGELLDRMEADPRLGLAGCRQLNSAGTVHPTIRRFPSATRCLFQALGSERYPVRASWLGERELDPLAYERETPCDWTSGSFMLARSEAIAAVGGMDERYFLYCEEPDLCLRLRRDGWQVRHLPSMTILHAARGSAPRSERLVAQEAYARRQYLSKNVTGVRRHMILFALVLGHLMRALSAGAGEDRTSRRAASSAAIRALLGLSPPPFATVLDTPQADAAPAVDALVGN
ncbi:MAG TPA: glycosyltransferase family 2 protein [Solirubrobacteraceae bacterium]|nr:glycosyltransferase family 2 protein [Solirubrobacteraceae bacterium]